MQSDAKNGTSPGSGRALPSRPSALEALATEIEQILPRIARRLFTVDPSSEINELPLAQLRVCTILQHGPRSLSAVAEELGVSVSAATQLADRMERAGLVARIASECDRRIRNLELTDRGKELTRSRTEMRVRRVREALESLSPEDRTAVLYGVEKLLKAAIGTAPEPVRADPLAARQQEA